MENSKEMSSWLHDFGLDHPLVIAGPCSAETGWVFRTWNFRFAEPPIGGWSPPVDSEPPSPPAQVASRQRTGGIHSGVIVCR